MDKKIFCISSVFFLKINQIYNTPMLSKRSETMSYSVLCKWFSPLGSSYCIFRNKLFHQYHQGGRRQLDPKHQAFIYPMGPISFIIPSEMYCLKRVYGNSGYYKDTYAYYGWCATMANSSYCKRLMYYHAVNTTAGKAVWVFVSWGL